MKRYRSPNFKKFLDLQLLYKVAARNLFPVNCDDGFRFQEVVESIGGGRLSSSIIYGGNATFGPHIKGGDNNVGHDFATGEVQVAGRGEVFCALALYPCVVGDSI